MAEHQDPIVLIQGRQYVVKRIGLLVSTKIQKIREQVLKTLPEDPDAQTLLVVFYPVMAGCSTEVDGLPVLSPNEYLEMDPLEASAWYEAALAQNPTAFPAPLEVEPESETKKEIEPTESISK